MTRAAGLQPIATVLSTEAVLIKSTMPSSPTFKSELIDLITKHIAGVLTANCYVLYTYNSRWSSPYPLAIPLLPCSRMLGTSCPRCGSRPLYVLSS
jgi:ATP phosphoribosyltransferase